MSLLDKIDKEVRLKKPYPSKIIIGEDAFESLKEEMHKRFAMGLKVNLQGEYTSLFGMKIEIDHNDKQRVEYAD